MVKTLRDRLRIASSLLILAGVLLFPFACSQVDPIQGCNGQDSNCGSPTEFRCINDRCYRTDPCGAGIFRFFGAEAYVDEVATTKQLAENYTVRQVFNADQLRDLNTIRKPLYTGEVMELPPDGDNYPMRFEVDFFDAVATKNSEERQIARNGDLFGVYVEANIAVATGALPCAAYLYVWANKEQGQERYAKICIGDSSLSLVQGERQFLEQTMPEGFDGTVPHTYRLTIKPELNTETNVAEDRVSIFVDSVLITSLGAGEIAIPAIKPNRVALYGFGSEARGETTWDWVRWGCNPDGGNCLPEVQADDSNACNDLRNFGTGIDCQGGRGVADEVCDGLDNDCVFGPDDIFRSTSENFRPFTDRLTGDRLQLDDQCGIGECTNARVACNPNDRTTMFCDRDAHFRNLQPAGVEVVVIPEEICDNKDNDCDGVTDEDFGFVLQSQADSGLRRYVDPTDPAPGTPLAIGEPCGKGVCAGARVVCGPSGLPQCEKPPQVNPELCGDALDNDCDGKVDEGFDRDGDNALACDCAALTGGVCEASVKVDCNDDPADDGANFHPDAPERCNDRDDDCDGLIDEGLDADGDGFWPCQRANCRETCPTDSEDCCLRNNAGRVVDCNDDADDVNADQINPAMAESCNNTDDDCDSEVDEGFARDTNPETSAGLRGYDTNANCGACGFSCADAPSRQGLNFVPICLQQAGGGFGCSNDCAQGFFDADRNLVSGCECAPRMTDACNDELAAFASIEGAVGCSELCDGIDNDCDGNLDEGAPVLQDVIDRLRTGGQRADQFQLQLVTRPCFTHGAALQFDNATSICKSGRMSCRNGEQTGAGAFCLGQVGPAPVEACNGLDDDCDGVVDEAVPAVGQACTVQLEDNSGPKAGICAYGRIACTAGVSQCVQQFQPRLELCNLEDDDCDGRIDNGFDADQDGFRSCGVCGDNQTPVNVETCSAVPDLNPNNNCACVDDCNDTAGIGASINRTRPEVCDGLDNDCNGLADDPFTGTDVAPGSRNDAGNLIYARDARFCGSCNNNCNDLPNVQPGSTSCVFDGSRDNTGSCAFSCLPNYADQNPAAPGCETSLCTPDTDDFELLGLGCSKIIVDGANQPVADCSCRATYRCEQVGGQYLVKCVSDPARGSTEAIDRIELLACTGNGANPERVSGIRVDVCDSLDNDCDGRVDEDFRNAQGAYTTQDHCGACNQACRAPNASPVCSAGVCTLIGAQHCDNGFVDLDGDIANGCEYRCSKVSATTDNICDGVRDANNQIVSGDDDCDGLLDEDIRFQSDLNNCGSCGNVCNYANAFSLCTNGQCVIDRSPNQPPTAGCVNGFADCDVTINNGCEVDLRTEFNDCGACDFACSPLSATQCAGRACSCGNSGSACLATGQSVVCDPSPDVVGGNTRYCVQCLNDTHCIGNPTFNPQDGGVAKLFCQAKQCKECVSGTNDGCVAQSDSPVCDRTDLACRGCRNNAECQVLSAQTTFCADDGPDDGKCVLCDPDTNFGCSGNTPVCKRAANGTYSCNACQVVPGQPDQCGGGRTCLAATGACSGCNLATDEGCNNPTPVCKTIVGGGERCEGCTNSIECNRNQGPGDPNRECVNGSCVACNPTTHAGCAANELCCNFECVQTNGINGCESCGAACNDVSTRACENRNCTCTVNGQECGGVTPFCDDVNSKCEGCLADSDCTVNPRRLCVSTPVAGSPNVNQCQACEPGTNRGCDMNSVNPICDPTTFSCRSCSGDAECDADVRFDPANRAQCVSNGSCQFCDPVNDAGCIAQEASVCVSLAANNYQCRGCQGQEECSDNATGNRCSAARCGQCGNDNECKISGGGPHPAGNVCLAANGAGVRNCGACINAASCDGHSTGNLCVNGNCGQCNTDAQCAVLRPNEPYCVPTTIGGVQVGICKACDPLSDRPCTGVNPVCEPATSTCRPCANSGECNNGLLCVAGACQACNADTDAGCNLAFPVCSGAGPSCRPCIDDTECVGNPNGTGNFCFQGQCRTCNPNTDAGCQPLSATPVCNQANFTCVGCSGDGDCTTNAGNGGECVAPSCRVCDPATHDGCRANELCCAGGGGVPVCVATSGADGARCSACSNGSCDPEVANVCNGRTCGCGAGAACQAGQLCSPAGVCVGCIDDGDCAGDTICNASTGQCQACRPGTHEGCGPQQLCCPNGGGGAPICVATGGGPADSCGACGASCDQARSDTCVDRACACGAANQCGGAFKCNDAAMAPGCVECLVDSDCPGATNCVSNSCGACDPLDDRGCNPASATPFCVNQGGGTACVACDDAAVALAGKSCLADDDNGDLCIPDGRCVECDDSDDCSDPLLPVCGASKACRRCNDNPECVTLDPDLPLCDASGACIGCRNNLDCDNPAPVCGVDGGVADCVACTGNNDCTGIVGHPVCVQALGCVECATSANCEVGEACIAGTCAPCINDGQCDNGNVCDEDLGRCVVCDVDTDCDDDELCCVGGGGEPACVPNDLNGGCEACGLACDPARSAECTDRACLCGGNDCGANEFCLNSTTCVECRGNGDCGVGAPICNAAKVCVQCTTNAECSGNTPSCSAQGICQACNLVANGCVGEATGEVCKAGTGACVECTANVDCDLVPGEPICNVGTNLCEACDNDTDCVQHPNGAFCDEGGATAGQCVACTEDSECYEVGFPALAVCDSNIADPVCGGCTLDAECAARAAVTLDGLVNCDGSTATCVVCTASADCDGTPAQPICNASHTCEACDANADCLGNSAGEFCVVAGAIKLGQCVECLVNLDCAVGTCNQTTFVCVP